MTEPLLAIADLSAGYGGVPAIDGIDLAVGEGQGVALLGANGAGKSTLMKAIIGLVKPMRGSITFAGERIETLRPERRVQLGIGYCPEGRRVFPGLSVWENLAVACWDRAAVRSRSIDEMFGLFPILAERQASPAWQLSGGQQQMLAIARALMNRPRLLLLDEPSLGLSPRLTEEVVRGIPTIRQSGTAVLLAEQNAAKALQVCDQATILKVGKVARSGQAAELAASDEIKRAFLGGRR